MKTCIGDAVTRLGHISTSAHCLLSPIFTISGGGSRDQRPDRYTLLIMNLGDCVFRMTAAAANMYLFQTFHIKDND